MITNSRELHDNGSHVVQLHNASAHTLTTNVVGYIADALKQGGGALVIATSSHRDSFIQGIARTGVDTDDATRCGRLLTFDADATLARIMVGGHPDGERFDRIVGTAIRDVKKASGEHRVRAYGEMVGLLWKAKQYPAAIRLEQLWNRARATNTFDLFCAYPIDVFDKDFDLGVMDAILCAHTHLLPTGADSSLQFALQRAIEEIDGLRTTGPKNLVPAGRKQSWAALPEAEATILWLRANLPEKAEEILTRARTYYLDSA